MTVTDETIAWDVLRANPFPLSGTGNCYPSLPVSCHWPGFQVGNESGSVKCQGAHLALHGG
eukprot:3745584-Amphidinium_carterae.1